MKVKASEALKRAAELIEDVGWARGWGDHEEGVCILHAIHDALGLPHKKWGKGSVGKELMAFRMLGKVGKSALVDAINTVDSNGMVSECAESVWAWNDCYALSAKQVTDALKLAGSWCRKKPSKKKSTKKKPSKKKPTKKGRDA